ncbi:hypothetical protein [Pareuzebyella sediminis]|uniref:hypothetical protein n=1 Tax=Pareuzebyella sediminis TaxID=2607998 RepID=UPI0011EC4C11|nr:hypothetical protein [Pareuzebyella sediminis]
MSKYLVLICSLFMALACNETTEDKNSSHPKNPTFKDEEIKWRQEQDSPLDSLKKLKKKKETKSGDSLRPKIALY